MPTAAADTFVIDRVVPIMNADRARRYHVPLGVGTYLKGTILGEITASGLYIAYVDAAGDGSGIARNILEYACVVDASNNITIADGSGATVKTAPVYMPGGGIVFQGTDLVGLDASGFAELQGVILDGSLATGLLQF
jgi:hypothetical protein